MADSASGQLLLEKVRETIEKYSMINRGDGIIVAVSGGPDSVALLHLLEGLKARLSFWIVAAHLDHWLRPESGEDRDFVRSLANERGIKARTLGLDVRGLAAKEGVSIEEAGRRARYAFLEQTRIAYGAQRIATAHHRDDELETFLLRILRGTSLTGLRGIPPVRGRIIRPLIRTRRGEILRFLEQEGISFRTDPSNLGTGTDRNFIRNRVLPFLRTRFPSFDIPLERTLDLVAEEEDFLDKEALRLYTRAVSETEDGLRIDVSELVQAPDVLASRVILTAVYGASGPEVRWTRTHVEAILNMIRSDNPSGKLHLPRGLVLAREYGAAFLYRESAQTNSSGSVVVVDGPGIVEIPYAGITLEFRLFEEGEGVPLLLDGRKTALFDADQVPFPLTIRPPKPGDRFRPWGMEGTRRLKKVLIDLKVPAARRHEVPLVVKDDRILWIPGIRRSREAPVRTGETKRVLEVSLVSKEDMAKPHMSLGPSTSEMV